MVFVGYGVHAPERGWNDYKDVDLRGKVAVYLINDPDFEAAAGDDAHGKFGGKAATYYARWTYKYEEAVRRGAVAALIVHETEPAAYGWNTAIAPNGEGYDIVRADAAREKLLLQSWIHRDAAVEVLRAAGLDLDVLKRSARRRDFRPVELRDVAFTADFPLAHERIESHNVLGKVTGAKHPGESIMVGAHWDAYGGSADGAKAVQYRAGALDDAIGVAGALEVGRAFRRGPPPDRTLVVAAWTAEERGLLGSEYYAANPALPLETTVANFTLDVLQPNGLARDVVLVGNGQSELDALLARTAATQNRVVTPDAKPERGLAFRADHFPFAKRGVPALLFMGMGGGHDLVVGGRDAGDRWVSEYTANCYHQACDRWSDSFDLRGAAQDVTLVYEMARELGGSRTWPQWNATSEFRAVREESATRRK
jgi:Zn-dependent M28 family amino/carboxypeptidase